MPVWGVATKAICAKAVPLVDLWTTNPVSLVELSCHARRISHPSGDTCKCGVAVKLLGAAGTVLVAPPVPPPPEPVVMASATLEGGEKPASFFAEILYQ